MGRVGVICDLNLAPGAPMQQIPFWPPFGMFGDAELVSGEPLWVNLELANGGLIVL
jgi:hypothetical protein